MRLLLFTFIAVSQTAVSAADVTKVTIEPTRIVLTGNLDRVQVVVSGWTADERRVDLTRSVEYRAAKPFCAVNEHGLVSPQANGKATILATVAGKEFTIPVEVNGIAAKPAVSFRNDVTPILSKAGCNSGGCHATQYGQGGLKLSLLGFAPEQDHAPLARDRRQRRVSLIKPDDSLMLRKATMQVAHGGGRRFKKDSHQYEILRTWIAGGCPTPSKKDVRVADLSVYPAGGVYRVKDTQQLRVVANYSDGRTQDVTQRAMFDSLGDAVAQVDESGHITIVGNGQAAVMVRYQGQAKISQVLSPFNEQVDLTAFQPHNFIDELTRDHWQRLGVKPADLCTDAEFIRRAYLDAIGTLPTADRIEAFLKSDAPDKRNTLIDELLGVTGDPNRDVFVNEWSAYWALKWGDLLRNNRNTLGDGGMWSLANWIRQSLRENKPVDQFVREIITAQGSIYQNGPANFFKIAKKPEDLAETTAQVFLGVRMQCAKCHHHPFEVYSQADYYGLAAFFTRVGTKSSTDFGALGADTVVKLNSSGSIRHPRTRQVMQPTPLLGEPVDASNVRDLRRPLADWLTSSQNELFAKNIVNRVWGYFMGSGIVEPIDDMRATNPPSNPALLNKLADEFVAGGYDIKKLMRAIMRSRVYQLSSTPRPENASNTRFYLHYNLKRLPAEVMLDAIDFACGTRERFRGVPLGTRAIELPGPHFDSYFLDTLGRPQRVINCECERTAEPNLAGVLHISNSDLIQRKLNDRSGRVAKLLRSKAKDEDVIRTLYLVSLSRPPADEEVAICRKVIQNAKSRHEGVEDILWALINTREFVFNH